MGWLSKRAPAPATPILEPAPAPALAPPPPKMMVRAEPPPSPNTIAQGTSVRGDLKGEGGFRIDGHVDGSVESGGPVAIGEHGSVSGFVRGTNIVVEGTVNGDVSALGHLEIGPRGRLIGDAAAKSVRVAEGGVFRGMSRMGDAMSEGEITAAIPKSESDLMSGERWRANTGIRSQAPSELTAAEVVLEPEPVVSTG